MSKIFISHSTKNQELAKQFMKLLQTGMGFARKDIFCTSLPNTLPTGEAFIEKIREELKECEAVIFLITREYLKSRFCLAELGAAWGLSKQIYPMLLVDIEEIENTPLKGLQVLFLERESDITALYDDLCGKGIITSRHTTEYMSELPNFMEQIEVLVNGEYLLQKDKDGYYHTEIVEARPVKEHFRCYKIKGHVDTWEAEDEAKTDWLFYHKGMYEDLKVGDTVRFQFTKEEIKQFPDIGIARNIYPATLEKEN